MTTFLNNPELGDKGQRVTTWLPEKTVRWIDATRGYYSKSQFIEIAVDKLREEIEKDKEAKNNSES